MIFIATILTAYVKALIDSENWGKVNHTRGAMAVSIPLVTLCFLSGSFYPIFLYGMSFNLILNKIRRLPFFYIGKTAKTDIFLRKVFPGKPGEAFFLINLILFLSTI